ncbi:hypothetical protein L7F22_045504 [Adiantum nelumboides]|nr:hypothetical protein [Adiantum nelumboides]
MSAPCRTSRASSPRLACTRRQVGHDAALRRRRLFRPCRARRHQPYDSRAGAHQCARESSRRGRARPLEPAVHLLLRLADCAFGVTAGYRGIRSHILQGYGSTEGGTVYNTVMYPDEHVRALAENPAR